MNNEYTVTYVKRGWARLEELFELIHNYGYIAGGMARYVASPNDLTALAEDVDIFCREEKSFDIIKALLLSRKYSKLEFENELVCNIFFKPHCTYGTGDDLKVQIIKPRSQGKLNTFGTEEEILNNFDYPVTKALINNSNSVMVHKGFSEDEITKTLHLLNINCPIAAISRMVKYAGKGYKISMREIIKVFAYWDNMSFESKMELTLLLDKSREERTEEEKSRLYMLTRID